MMIEIYNNQWKLIEHIPEYENVVPNKGDIITIKCYEEGLTYKSYTVIKRELVYELGYVKIKLFVVNENE